MVKGMPFSLFCYVLEPPLRRQFRGVNLVLKLGVVGPKSSTD